MSRILSLGLTLHSINHNIGVLIIRIGFWAHYSIIRIRTPPNSIGNDLSPYINLLLCRLPRLWGRRSGFTLQSSVTVKNAQIPIQTVSPISLIHWTL